VSGAFVELPWNEPIVNL